MNYLKLVNCHVRGLFPEKTKKAINWDAAGFNPVDISRDQVNGFDAITMENHVTLYPIANEDKFLACDAYGNPGVNILDTVNNNAYPGDTAEIITDVEADALKIIIANVKTG